MASKSAETIIIRVKPAVKRAARRGAKTEKVNLTAFLTSLIERYDVANQPAGEPAPDERKGERA